MKLLDSLKMKGVVWVWNHTPDCAEMARLSSRCLEQAPSFETRCRMWLHRLICVWCERYQKHLKFLHQAAPRFHEEIEGASQRKLSQESRQRMVRRLHEEAGH